MDDENLKIIPLENSALQIDLVGEHNKNLTFIEKEFDINIFFRENKLFLHGSKSKINSVAKVIQILINKIKNQELIDDGTIHYAIDAIENNKTHYLLPKEFSNFSSFKKKVFPKSLNQEIYLDNIIDYDVVFAIGPAGTGKTFLSVAAALSFLQSKIVSKIIITRPVIEAGESLGFLPGDYKEKINPYLQPIYDSFNNLISPEKLSKLMKINKIEIAPLAYMRGRTLSDAFVILDEAQNTTSAQMKMFLTRLGVHSKVIITGDITQIDLEKQSGLVKAQNILNTIQEIKFIYFNHKDVIRHKLVKSIIKAYSSYENPK